MLAIVKAIAGAAVLCSELIAAGVIVVVRCERSVLLWFRRSEQQAQVDPLRIFRSFARLVLAREFPVTTDILKRAISPTRTEIG